MSHESSLVPLADPAFQEDRNSKADRAGVAALAELLGVTGQLDEDVLLACRVAAANCIAERSNDNRCPKCGELVSFADTEPYCAYVGCLWNNGGDA